MIFLKTINLIQREIFYSINYGCKQESQSGKEPPIAI